MPTPSKLEQEFEQIDREDPNLVDDGRSAPEGGETPEGGEQGEEGSSEGQPGAQPGVQKQPPVEKKPLTLDDIAELNAKLAAKLAQQSQPKPEPKQLSQEEIDKILNPVKIDAEFLKGLGIAEPTEQHLKAYQQFANMMTKHHSSLTQLMLENRMRELTSQAEPMYAFYQQQQAERQKQAFFTRHPTLNKFGKFVQFAASQVQPTKADGTEKSMEEAMDEIAENAKSLLKESGVDVDALGSEEDGESTTLGAPKQTTVPRMASLQAGGRSGSPSVKGGGNNPDADIYS